MKKFLSIFMLAISFSVSALDIALSKEILYFRPSGDNMEYSIIQDADKNGSIALKVCNPTFSPSLGNRLKFSFALPTDWWVSLYYTNINFDCLSKKKHDKHDITNFLALDSEWNYVLAKEVRSHWLIDYHSFDFKINKTFDVSKYISIGSSFAAKAHYFKNNYDTKYLDLLLPDGNTLISNQFVNGSSFLGAGIEVGFNGIFRLTNHWSLFYTVNSGMLKGNFKNSGYQNKEERQEFVFLNSRKGMVPMISHSIGIQYSTYKGPQVDLDFSIAYEATLFSNHLKMFTLNGFHTSNILMDGLVFKAQIGF